jgi:hypothetical protein
VRVTDRVVEDYLPETNAHLTLILDDLVYVFRQSGPDLPAGFWEGETLGVTGMFPSKYVQINKTLDEEIKEGENSCTDVSHGAVSIRCNRQGEKIRMNERVANQSITFSRYSSRTASPLRSTPLSTNVASLSELLNAVPVFTSNKCSFGASD